MEVSGFPTSSDIYLELDGVLYNTGYMYSQA